MQYSSMTQNRKRGRNTHEDEVEFMPLSKRINNLHINNSGLLSLDNSNGATSGQLQHLSSEWGPGPPFYGNGNPSQQPLTYNAPETPPECVPNINFDNPNTQYNPVLSETENPHYYYKNKLLFEMHLERMQRTGQNF